MLEAGVFVFLKWTGIDEDEIRSRPSEIAFGGKNAMELRDLHRFPCTAEVESPHNQQPLCYSDEGKVSGLENNSRHFIQYGIVELEIFFLADYIGDY